MPGCLPKNSQICTNPREASHRLVYASRLIQATSRLAMSTSDRSVPVSVGETIDGKYRVDHVLGAGGMGVVLAATRVQLGQRVAIKFLLPSALEVPGARERFTREARAAARLGSEHVVRVMDVGALASGAPYMIMEFLEGCDLGKLLQNKGPLPIDDAVDYVMQACDALAEAHGAGIVHRDLKPTNLFLATRPNGSSSVKVLDFGISKVAKRDNELSLTKTSDVIGSPIYMAPEQIRSSRDVDVRTDMWALGVILYELLTGHVPFPGMSVPQLCSMVLEQQPDPIDRYRPEIPFELAAAILRCLEKDPARRFQSVAELTQAIFPFTPGPAASGLARSRTARPPFTLAQPPLQRDDPSGQFGATLVGPSTPPSSPGTSHPSSPWAPLYSPPAALTPPAANDRTDRYRSVPSISPASAVPNASHSVQHQSTLILFAAAGALLLCLAGLAAVLRWALSQSEPLSIAAVPSASISPSTTAFPSTAAEMPSVAPAVQPSSSITADLSISTNVPISAPPSERHSGGTAPTHTPRAPPPAGTTRHPAGNALPDERK